MPKVLAQILIESGKFVFTTRKKEQVHVTKSALALKLPLIQVKRIYKPTGDELPFSF